MFLYNSTNTYWSITDSEAIAHLKERNIKIRDAYNIGPQKNHDLILEKIKSQLMIGYKDGSAIGQIAGRIRKELVGLLDISIDQASIIARTEINGSASYSRYLAINRSGYRKKKWFTANDEKVRPLHREMHGKIVNVGDLWFFSDGNSLRYPGDHEGPDHLVVNCRCIEVIVFESHEYFMNDT